MKRSVAERSDAERVIIAALLSVMLAVLLSAGALAEQTVPGSAPVPAPAEAAVPGEPLAAAEPETGEQAALEQALAAFRALKGSGRVKDMNTLKAELEDFVKAGKLTQEQADLILGYYTEQFTAAGAGRKQKGSDDGQNRKKGGKGQRGGNAEPGNLPGRHNKNRNGKGTTEADSADPDAASGTTEKKK